MSTSETASRVDPPPVLGGGAERPTAVGSPDPSPDLPPAAEGDRSFSLGDPRWVGALIGLVGILLTVLSSWLTARVDHSTEQRLLENQTRQAASVLSTAVLLIQEPLTTALSVQMATRSGDDAEAFENLMAAYVGPGKMFESASLWRRSGDRLRPLAQAGVAPGLDPASTEARDYVRSAFASKTFKVRQVRVGDRTRIAYVRGDDATGYAIYAERSIPANRRAPVDRDSAFAQLHYAIYLGSKIGDDTLSTTDVQPSTLPLTGNTARVAVPFGDTVLTLVTTPREHLGAPLSQRLPWMLLAVGLLLTFVAARAGQQLARGRRDAEEDAAIITSLYEKVEVLYGQERELSLRLQRALLPHMNPSIPQVQVASDYIAGARGVDIGGDWYSIVALDDRRFVFVVGDVSGHGVDAVAVMAQARFTIRAYLLDGHSPSETLEKCSRQFDIVRDGHMTTAVVGIGDRHTGEITLASAGHPAPVVLTDAGVETLDVSPGWPLGVGPTTYTSTTIQLSPGATLFCFTDGLVERREEHIEMGLERLAETLSTAPRGSVEALVDHTVRSLRSRDASDDIAVLAIRWGGSA